jgi:hypothetical protein
MNIFKNIDYLYKGYKQNHSFLAGHVTLFIVNYIL